MTNSSKIYIKIRERKNIVKFERPNLEFDIVFIVRSQYRQVWQKRRQKTTKRLSTWSPMANKKHLKNGRPTSAKIGSKWSPERAQIDKQSFKIRSRVSLEAPWVPGEAPQGWFLVDVWQLLNKVVVTLSRFVCVFYDASSITDWFHACVG